MVTFPELRALMAKHGLNQERMGEKIGSTYQTFGRKLNCISEFTYDDMIAIYRYFSGLGEEITMDRLFFDWRFTTANIKEAQHDKPAF